MFIGHFAPAFVAAAVLQKSNKNLVTPQKIVGLGLLFVAGQLIDFGFFGLVLLGIEKMRIVPGISAMNPMDLYYMPYTHSLLGASLWAIIFGWLVWVFTRNKAGAIAFALVVLSHWFVDLLVHIPDLSFVGEPQKFGLGLWNNPPIAMSLEVGITLASLFYYLVSTEKKQGQSHFALGALVAILATVQSVDWLAPAPTEFAPSMAWTALVAYTLCSLLAAWLSRTRTYRSN